MGEWREQHAPEAAIVFADEGSVCLIVEDVEALGLSVAAVAIVEHVEGAANLFAEVACGFGILAAVDHRFVEDEVHALRHLAHEFEYGLFLGMDWSEETVLWHVLRHDSWTDAFGQSGTQVAQALAVGMRLGAERGGAESVLPPLLYPVLRCLSVALGIATRLLLFVEGFAHEAMCYAGDGGQLSAVEQILVAGLDELQVLKLAQDVASCLGDYGRLADDEEHSFWLLHVCVVCFAMQRYGTFGGYARIGHLNKLNDTHYYII